MKNLIRRLISLCLCMAVMVMSFGALLSVNAATKEWKEDFEKAVALSDTDYFSNGVASIIDNGIDGKSVNVVTAGGYQTVAGLNIQKAVLKSGCAYTVSFDLDWTIDASGTNNKWGFNVKSTAGTSIGYMEFYADNGAGGWADASLPTALSCSSNVLEDRISFTFSFTPSENAYFEIWNCGSSGTAVIDNIKIEGSELVEFKELTNEKFDTATSLNDTNYYTKASAEIVENGIDGKSANISTSVSYEGILCQNTEKIILKAGVTYKVSLNLKWTPETEGVTSKTGFWLGTSDRTELAYLEFFADTGAFCYSSSSVISYSGSAENGVVTSTFVFTPSQNAMFEIWNSGGSAATVLMDNIKIEGSELVEFKELTNEKFDTATSLNDTNYYTKASAEIVENGIDGKSANISTSVSYEGILCQNTEKIILKAGVTYKVSLNLKWTPETEGVTSKTGFWLGTPDRTELAYLEFFADTGAFCYSSSSVISYSGSAENGVVTSTFVFTPSQNAMFEIWNSGGSAATVLMDNIKIEGSELIEIKDLVSEKFETAVSLDDTIFNTAGQASITESGIDGKSASITTAGGYKSVIALNPEKALLKAGISYNIKLELKWTPDTEGQNSKYGFRVISAAGTEIGWKEFFALDGAGGWTNTGHPVAIDYSSTVLEDRICVSFKITPTENAYFDIWDCGGSGTAVIDNIIINASDIIIKGDIDGDYVCNASDLIIMRKALLGIEEILGCDINGDGSVNVVDLVRMKKLAI